MEGPWSYGEPARGQGERTDLSAAKAAIDAGHTDHEVAQQHFAVWCKHYRAFDRYRRTFALRALRDRAHPEVRIFWGATSTGKSHRAFTEAAADAYWWSPPSHANGPLWFDGYEQQEDIIIDDFDGASIPISFLLRFLDRYPLLLPVKGGFAYNFFKRVFITSNLAPESWYPELAGTDRRRAALERRFTLVAHMSVVYNPNP